MDDELKDRKHCKDVIVKLHCLKKISNKKGRKKSYISLHIDKYFEHAYNMFKTRARKKLQQKYN